MLQGGVGYNISKHFSLQVAYTHYFCMSSTVDLDGTTLASALQLPEGRLIGGYSNSIDSGSVGLKLPF